MWNAWASTSLVDIFPSTPGRGNANQTVNIISGNTLGGASAVNGLQWVVPQAGTVESWGIRGLSTASSRKFYRRAFRQVGFAAQQGALKHIYARDYIRAAAKAGFPENDDPFDTSNRRDMFENRLAVDKRGRRVDSCTAYLLPALKGKCKHNLRLIQGVTVTRIILRGTPKRATGVEYVRSNDKKLKHPRMMHAEKEVLVAAGPFESPKLLQLSGIGPPRLLQSKEIKPVVALPVGKKTQSRNFIGINSLYKVPLEPSNNSTLLNSKASRRKFESGMGGVLGTGSFFANGIDRRNAYTTGTGNFFPAFVDMPVITSNCNGNVDSFGFLRIQDSNPFTPPKVDLALLKEQAEVERLKRCLKRLINIHREFPKRFQMSFLSPPDGRFNESWIRSNAGWAGHFVGGCAVGTVLRPDLTVRKTEGLRVIDSSALKTIPISAGPMASTYMLAEYASQLVANKYK